MKKLFLGALLVLAAGLAMISVVAYNGWIDVAADTPHDPLVFNAIEWARERSIARRLEDISSPKDLGSEQRVRLGAGNYEAMCSGCHLKPGVTDSEIRQGLYPQPPSLTAEADDEITHPARRFWIIKHGIKASGMPAWGKGGMTDEDIWNLVAFLDRLPDMTSEQYLALQVVSKGHMHGGETMHESEPTQEAEHSHGHDDNHSH